MTTKQYRNPPFKGNISSDPPQIDNLPYKLTLQQSTPIKRTQTKEFPKTNIYAQHAATARGPKPTNTSQNDFSKLSKKNSTIIPNSIYTIVSTPKNNPPNRSSLNIDTSSNLTSRVSIQNFFSPRAATTFGLPEQDFQGSMSFANEASQDSGHENKLHETTRIKEKIKEIREYIEGILTKAPSEEQDTQAKSQVSLHQGLEARLMELNQLLRRKYQLWEELEVLDKLQDSPDAEVFRVINKFTKKVYVKKTTKLPNDGLLSDKILTELVILLKIQENSSLLRLIYAEYVVGKRCSVVLEYGRGLWSDLSNFMKERLHDWDEKLLLELFYQLHEQVLLLKELKIHHLDINPKNIIINESFSFKLRNYSTSLYNLEPSTQEFELVGTEGYMAPEILENIAKGLKTSVYDPYKADIYSIAMTVLSLALNKNALGVDITRDLKDLSRTFPKLSELLYNAFNERMIPTRESKELSKKDIPSKLIKKFNVYTIDKIYEKIKVSPTLPAQKYSILHMLDEIETWLYKKLEEAYTSQTLDSVEKGRFSMIHGCILEAKGAHDEAKQKYLEILNLNSDPSSVSNFESAEAYFKIAEIFTLQEKYAESAMCYLKSLNIYRNILPESHPELARLNFKLGKVYAIQKNFEGALKFFMANTGSYTDKNVFVPYLPNAHENISWVYAKQNNYQEAISYFKRGIEFRIMLYGENHAELIKCYENISELFLKVDDFKQALDYQIKSLDVIKNINPENGGLIGRRCGRIGRFCLRARKYEEALSYLEQGLKTLKEDPEELQVELANFYRRIGLANFKLKKYKAALESYGNSCHIRIKLNGESSVDLAEDYNHMGLIYMANHKYVEALVYFLRCIQVRLSTQTDPSEMATYFYNLGMCFFYVDKFEESADSFKRSLDHIAKIEKTETDQLPDFWSGDALFCLGVSLRRIKKYKEALEALKKCLDIRSGGNKSDQSLGPVYEEIAIVYESQSSYEESFNYFEKALDAYLKNSPQDYPRLAKSYSDLGLNCCIRKNYPQAIEYYLKSANLLSTQISNPLQQALCLRNLAFAYFDSGDDTNARGQAQKAREIFLTVLSEDHSHVKDLNEILQKQPASKLLSKIPELPESPDTKQKTAEYEESTPPKANEIENLQIIHPEKVETPPKEETSTQTTISSSSNNPPPEMDEKIHKIFQRYMSQLPGQDSSLQRPEDKKDSDVQNEEENAVIDSNKQEVEVKESLKENE